MAWLKDIQDDKGVTAGYWEIDRVNVGISTGVIDVIYLGWISKDMKDQGMEPYCSKNVSFLSSILSSIAEVSSDIQIAIMALPEFVGSTGV